MEMTMLEYQLRRDGFFRKQKDKLLHTRSISYYSLVATGAIDTRKMSIEKFMPLESSEPKGKPKMSNAMRKAFENAQNQYLEETNGSGT